MLEQWQGLVGVVAIGLVAALASENRAAIRARVVLACFALQVGIAVLVLYVPLGKTALAAASTAINTLLGYTNAGIDMVFGGLAADELGYSFFIRVLPVIIFFAALMEVLYHLRIMPFIVKWGGRALRRVTATRPIESLNVVANMFVGQVEAPLSLKPYLPGISRFELFTIMVSGLASIAGSVMAGYISLGVSAELLVAAAFMSAPGGLLMAKLIMPEPVQASHGMRAESTVASVTTADRPLASVGAASASDMDQDVTGSVLTVSDQTDLGVDSPDDGLAAFTDKAPPREHTNVIMAAAAGAQNGTAIAIAVAAMLIAFVSLIALANGLLGWAGGLAGFEGLTVQTVFGAVFAPLMWAIGVPWAEAAQAGALFGEKVVLNEFVAYISLTQQAGELSPRTVTLMTFALCGFANLSSIGILLGGLGTIIPERKPEIARLGLKAVFAASLANLMSAALAGLVLGSSL